jgi:four helix bundle protein
MSQSKFVALEVAGQLIHALRPIIELIARHDPGLAVQTKDAASSSLLNLAEGNRRAGRDRAHHFRVSAGSAGEVGAAIEVSLAWGYFEPEHVAEVLPILDRLLGLLWGLTHPRRRA